MAPPSSAYDRRDPASTVLYAIVRDHFETFRAHAASLRDGEGLPRFVEQEFRDFLRCGCLAGGFARFRCTTCGLDRLVAFSCKGRGFCPRCGGRRMAERSAHLVDHVLPDVPVRQWVLSLPHRLRYLLAWDHELCRAVTGVALRTVLGFLRRRARRDGIPDGRSGAVVIIQRFVVAFHPMRRLTRANVAGVAALIARRVERLLERRGLAGGAESSGAPDPWLTRRRIDATCTPYDFGVRRGDARCGGKRPGHRVLGNGTAVRGWRYPGARWDRTRSRERTVGAPASARSTGPGRR